MTICCTQDNIRMSSIKTNCVLIRRLNSNTLHLDAFTFFTVFNNASQNCWNALNSLDNSSSTSVDIYDSYCDYFPLAVLNRLALQRKHSNISIERSYVTCDGDECFILR
jgi:hypothetical protein